MAASSDYQTPSSSLYVGDLPPEVNETHLFEIFSTVGSVASMRLCRNALSGASLGYAYVNFHSAQDAEKAIEALNFTKIGGRTCRIMWSQRDPTLRKTGVGNIFVKNLDPSIDHRALYDTFSVFGKILSCKVATSRKGVPLGYGFVHYYSQESANNAIKKVDGMMIAGKAVHVAHFVPRNKRAKDHSVFTNVYVKNLPQDYNKDDVMKLFAPFGEITSVMFPEVREAKKEGQKPKGFGFVNYKNPESAKAAVAKLNDMEYNGCKLYVGKAMKKSERQKMLNEQYLKAKAEQQQKWAFCNLYIKNLKETIDNDRLYKEFSKFGEITSHRIMTEANGRSRGFGFVCFSNQEAATKAIAEMNGFMLEDKPLFVAFAQPKEIRRARLSAQHAQRRRKQAPQGQFLHGYGQGMQGAPIYIGANQGLPGPQQMMYAPQPGGWGQPQQGFRGPPQQHQPFHQENPNPKQNAGQVQGRQAQGGQDNGVNKQMDENEQKQFIGEQLFMSVYQFDAARAGKITGMLLEMDMDRLIQLVNNPQALEEKIMEATAVLNDFEAKNAAAAGGDAAQD